MFKSFSGMKNLNIRTRITVLVAFPIIGLGLLGLAYLMTEIRIDTALEIDRAYEDLLEAAELIEAHAVQMREKEVEFLLHADMRLAEGYLNAARKIINQIEKASGLAVPQSFNDELRQIRDLTEQHIAKFREVVNLKQRIGLDENSGLEGNLRKSVHAVEEIIIGGAQETQLVKLLMMRRHEKDFMLRGDDKYIVQFDARRKEFDTLLHSPGLPLAVQTRISALMDSYQSDMHALAATSMEFEAEIVKLDSIFARIEPAFEKIVAEADEGVVTARRNLDATRQFMRYIWAAAAGLLLIVLLGIGISIFGSVVRPIRAITRSFRELSDGAANIVIPYRGQQDEIGEMADALAKFYAVSVDAMRTQSAVNMASTSFMIADPQFNIISLNWAAETMFRTAEAGIRTELPGFAAAGLIGRNLDLFGPKWKDGGEILKAAKDGLAVRLEIGDRIFDVVFTAVMSAHGEALGTAIEWKDLTGQITVEREIAEIVHAASEGQFSQRLREADKSGFMADLAKGMNELLDMVDNGLDQVVKIVSALAEGDLTKRMQGEHKGAFGRLKTDADRMGNRMEDMLGRISSVSAAVKTATDEISSGLTDLSTRTEHQASSLEETSASMEELSATVRQNADNAQQANQIASAAREAAEKGGDVTGRTVTAMGGIEDSSRQITEIVGLIQEIAFQTNLLALNASVEAARAGEAGRGFAVVADEVRALAQRTSNASKDIKALITSSDSQIQEGAKLVNETGTALDAIVDSVKKVADFVSEIASASQEQTTGLDQVSSAVTGMDELTQQNAALVEEATSTIESAMVQVDDLQQAVGFFKTAQRVQLKPREAAADDRPVANPVRDQQKKLAHRVADNLALAADTDDWQEF